MRRYSSMALGLILAGCGSAQVAAAPPARTGVAASCAAVSPEQQFASARLVFVGRMLKGPTIKPGGVLGSPARMRVERYLKGHGPSTVRVDTAVSIDPHGVAVGEDGIMARPGERWKIYTDSGRQPFSTSICAGSRRVAESPPGKRAGGALALWRSFPVHANPRPIVPLGEGMVLAPATGFRTEDQKLAFTEGRFVLGTALPPGSLTAFRRLTATGAPGRDQVPPLLITGVRLGAATFLTDRGKARLAAWEFSLRGVDAPASVLALAPAEVFRPPALHRFDPPGPGSSIADSATESPSGTTIKLSFAGAPPGTGPCEANYRAGAVASRRAVAFTITTIAAPVPPGQACPALAAIRTVALHLTKPLGARVLISAADGGAVPVTPAR